MKYSNKLNLLFYFTLGYLFLFSILAIFNDNYEFLYYSIVLSVLLFGIVSYARKVYFPLEIVAGLVVFELLHILGGNLAFGGVRLYDYWLLEGVRYDNVMHFLGSFLVGIAAYSLVEPYAKKNVPPVLIWSILVLIVMGVGALNEVLEFLAVVFLGAAERVGDYYNNAVDLVFNLIGGVLACFGIYWYRKRS
tara:strand:- start:1293 stop:1868 length:576 start_codon:yes stop_codon:yes gene_type:complete